MPYITKERYETLLKIEKRYEQHSAHLKEQEPEIKFSEPESWKYTKVLPIQFNILHH